MNKKIDFIGRDKEIEQVKQFINMPKQKHILFLEADGGIGKTRFLQEIEDIYLNDTNVILNDVIDYDNFPFFNMDIIKKIIIQKLGEGYFKDYLELEKEFINKAKSVTIKKQLQKEFVQAFNARVKNKKFILLLDTSEKIQSSSFWNELRVFLGDLNNLFVVISGRNKTLEGKKVNRRELYFDNQVDNFHLVTIMLRSYNAPQNQDHQTNSLYSIKLRYFS